MIIDTKRLHLRPVIETDVPNVQLYFPHWEIVQHLTTAVPWPYPEDGALDFYKTVIEPNQGCNRWFWAINEKERPDHMIGQIELRREPKGDDGHRGFWLALPYHGRGYMSEAVAAVMDCAFRDLGFEEITATNNAENPASRRVKEKTGMRFLHQQPDSDPSHNGVKIKDVWVMTRADWLVQQSQNG